jgi:hypothetical protein
MITQYDRERAHRNLNPHAEARLAMALWSHEYAFEQKGGSMDFWDSRTPAQQRLCVDIVSEILKANASAGRSALSQDGERI